jgi:hypothetical protein
MEQELSNMTTIVFVYILIFLKFLFFSNTYFDLQFFTSSLLIVLLIWINMRTDKLTNEMQDFGKFLSYVMFISICFSLVCGLFSFVYNILFYFGFVNTIIIINTICMFLMSELVPLFKHNLNEKLTKSNIGNKILSMITYYYNTYIVSKKLGQKILDYINFFVIQYVWTWCKFIFSKFIKINEELSNNSQSKIIKTKLNNKYSDAKNYIIEQIVQPFFIESFQNALKNDPFDIMIDPNNMPINKQKSYKNNLHNQNINMNFLLNTQVNNKDILDDLDDLDEAPDLSSIPAENQNETTDKIIDNVTDNVTNNVTDKIPDKMVSKQPTITAAERKAILKKKIAEKKASRRTGGTSLGQRSKQNQITNLMNMPGMNEMMETMLKGDNLEKIMKQMPKDQMDPQMKNIDPEQMKQMKQMIRTMNKKK